MGLAEQRYTVAGIAGGLRAVHFRLTASASGDMPALSYLSPSAAVLMGLDPAEAGHDLGRLLERIVDGDRQRLSVALQAAAVNAATWDLEVRAVAADGSVRLMLLSTAPTPKDEPLGCLGMLVDLGAREPFDHGRDALIARQHRIIGLLHDVAATANDAPDAEHAMRRCLEQVCAHGGWPIGHVYHVAEDAPRRLIPSGLWHTTEASLAPWDEATRTLALADGEGLPGLVLASGQPQWEMDVGHCPWFRRAELARRLGIRTGFAFPVRTGMELVAVLEFFTTETIPPDPLLAQALSHIGLQIGRVVERDRASRNLRVVAEMAQAAHRAKTNFLANMSHELRTPLNAIIGFAETMVAELFGPVTNDRYRDYVRYIHGAGTHLMDLIGDILDLSRIEAKCLDLAEEAVELQDLLDIVASMTAHQLDTGRIGFELIVPPGLPRVMGDPLRLRQILLNLLANAVHATPPGGAIRVEAGLDLQGGLELRVVDTGRGMSADRLELALRPLDAATPAHTRCREGAGLGLPLTRALVELHGGMLDIRSTVGKGTTAIVRLPPDRLRDRIRATG
ncbi:MAG: GAF domain-containing protein [Magnetospirillum sp.]|nr:GAF domain-containing protein [Magnetospirillum sp.]